MTTPSTQKKKRSLSTYLSYIGNIALALMMLLTTADVLGRYFFNAPVLGAYEITEYLMLIMVFSFLALAQSRKPTLMWTLFSIVCRHGCSRYVNDSTISSACW